MPFLAGQYAEQIGATQEELYSYQFALAPDAGEAIEGFSTRPFGARRLIHCPKLRVATLRDSEGGEIGYCRRNRRILARRGGLRHRPRRALAPARHRR